MTLWSISWNFMKYVWIEFFTIGSHSNTHRLSYSAIYNVWSSIWLRWVAYPPPLFTMHLSQLPLVRPQMSRLISSYAIKWQYLQCKEPSAGGNKSKSPVASEVASQFTPPVVFKRYSDGNFPLTLLTCATLTREDLRRDTKRRARAGDGEKQQLTGIRSNIWGGESPGPFFQLSLWSLV